MKEFFKRICMMTGQLWITYKNNGFIFFVMSESNINRLEPCIDNKCIRINLASEDGYMYIPLDSKIISCEIVKIDYDDNCYDYKLELTTGGTLEVIIPYNETLIDNEVLQYAEKELLSVV